MDFISFLITSIMAFHMNKKILIAMLIKFHNNKLPTLEEITPYEALLPDLSTITWLSFLLSFLQKPFMQI